MIPLGPFELSTTLGRGAMGEVWAGFSRERRVPVAVKILTREAARDPAFRAGFRNEVRAVAGLDHPAIVPVHDFGEVPVEAEERSGGRLPAGSPFVVMELQEGGSLAPLCGKLGWSELRAVLLCLLDGLAHAHAHGIVHRDLKPANVLLGRSGAGLRLTDFGLAHAVERESLAREKGAIHGTPAYMAPEQWEGRWRDYGPWTDLYALGCVAHALVAGEPPFGAISSLPKMMTLHLRRPPPVLEPRPGFPEGLSTWIARLLEKDPGRRFRRAADAAWALLRLDADAGRAPRSTFAPLRLVTPAFVEPMRAAMRAGADELTRRAPSPGVDPGVAPGGPLPPVARPPVPATWRRAHGRGERVRLHDAGLGLWGLRAIPLVGREAERDALWDALVQVHRTGRARVVVLRGPAGVGKSRLAEWLCERAHEVGAATVFRAVQSPVPAPRDGLVPMLARFLRTAGLPRPELLRRVEALARSQGVDDPDEPLALAELLAPSTEAERQAAGVRAVRFETPGERHALIRRLLAHLGRERVALLWLDDVQWGIDPLAFAASVLDAAGEAPARALLVLTVREEALAERDRERELLERLEAMPGALRLELGPLPPAERPALVRELLGLEGELARGVEDRTGGNPLFAVQLVGDWVQRGILEPTGRGFRIRPGAEAPLPDDLHQVWAGRVARLLDELGSGGDTGDPGDASADLRALELAAILGREVNGEEWRAACAEEGIVASPGLLDALLGSRLARTGEGGPQAAWSFVHGMLRESLERRAREGGRWREHHRACARMLEAGAPGPGLRARLGRHLVEAGELEAGLAPLRAGAVECIERGEVRQADLLLAEVERLLGKLEVVRDDPRWGETWLLRARVTRFAGDGRASAEWSRRAIDAASRHGWLGVGAAARIERGAALSALGDGMGRELLEEAARMASAGDDPELLARARAAMAVALLGAGELPEAAICGRAALAWADGAGDDDVAAEALLALSFIEKQAGRILEATAYAEKARLRHERRGRRAGVALALVQQGDLARLAGDLAGAEARYREALAIHRALGHGHARFEEANLGLVLLAQGRFPEARETFERALAAFDGSGQKPMVGAVHSALLACVAAIRDWAAWDHHLGEANRLFGETGFADVDNARLAAAAAETARAAGEEERARGAFALSASQWQGLGRDEEAARVLARLGAQA